MKQIQQGDVLLFVEPVPKTAIATELKGGVLEYGEHTGHCHKLHSDDFQYFETPEKTRHLRLVTPTALRHEEHKEIILPPGDYRIDRVKEYDHFAEEARYVMD